MTTTNDIDAIRKLTDAATPGPWRADDSEIYTEDLAMVADDRAWIGEGLQDDDPDATRANTAFVAAARTLVPALCDEVEQLRADLERTRRERDDEATQHGNTVEDLDDYQAMANRLADAIAKLSGVEIGEHSSMNDPWQNALDAAEAMVAHRKAVAS